MGLCVHNKTPIPNARGLGGTNRIRAVVAIDETYGLVPPHPANPPTKRPILTLMKQAPCSRVSTGTAADADAELQSIAEEQRHVSTSTPIGRPTKFATGVQMSASLSGVSMDTMREYFAPNSLRSRLGWSFHHPLTG